MMALIEGRAPLADLAHDIHLLEVIDAAKRAAKELAAVTVVSRFNPLDLRLQDSQNLYTRLHVHDHTRPEDEQ